MTTKSIKSKQGSSFELDDLFNDLSLKDPLDKISEKLEKIDIKLNKLNYSEENSENNSTDDSGYEEDKENKEESSDSQIGTTENYILPSQISQPVHKVEHDQETDITNDEQANSSTKLSTKVSNAEDNKEDTTVSTCHQDLIITGDKEDLEKDEDIGEHKTVDETVKNDKDVEASGYIRRTGKTLMTPPHGNFRAEDAMYLNIPKSFNNGTTDDRVNQYDMNSAQSFSPFLLSSNSSNNAQQNSQYLYSDSTNTGLWYDSPQSSPSPYYKTDASKRNLKKGSRDSDWDLSSSSGNSYLTPPPSVSPPKQFLDGTSCHQSCIQIVNLIDKVGQSSLGGSAPAPEDELKNLLSALDCEQDSSLWGMSGSFMGGNMAEQANVCMDDFAFNKDFQQVSDSNEQVSNMWKDIQETDSNELSVYLPHQLNVDEAERAVMTCCDPQTVFELESRVSEVLSNNPMAIIPDDQHGDTNLIVLASRDKDKRDKIVEKIYALAKGLANVRVCCNSPVENFQCMSCGNSNPESFHTPLTLSNVQGYTALSCAVLRGYPAVIVKYLVALIQNNKLDLAREFCGNRNKLYLSAREYPYLNTHATEYASGSW